MNERLEVRVTDKGFKRQDKKPTGKMLYLSDVVRGTFHEKLRLVRTREINSNERGECNPITG